MEHSNPSKWRRRKRRRGRRRVVVMRRTTGKSEFLRNSSIVLAVCRCRFIHNINSQHNCRDSLIRAWGMALPTLFVDATTLFHSSFFFLFGTARSWVYPPLCTFPYTQFARRYWRRGTIEYSKCSRYRTIHRTEYCVIVASRSVWS